MGIKRLIIRFASWLSGNQDNCKNTDAVVGYRHSRPPQSKANGCIEDSRGIDFTIYNATGGKIVQMRSYDPTLDRGSSSLYIITDKEDMGEELSLILTRESLTR